MADSRALPTGAVLEVTKDVPWVPALLADEANECSAVRSLVDEWPPVLAPADDDVVVVDP